ncbi:hypothetical protein [Fructilactobacillus frigidiflavus]|uniref:hypothetical protein n=1 Tax=Fructilactobacillus frigidiflavus TaxID=3242688 RepID=UPI003756C2D8
MKKKNLLESDLEKRFDQLEKGHPEPEKLNKRDIMVKIVLGFLAIILVGLVLIPLIRF